MDAPGNIMFAPSELLPGDFVQARREYESGAIGVVEGTVLKVNGTVVDLDGPDPDGADGWTFELISRPLEFPEALCEIDATLLSGELVRLMGRGAVWTRPNGGQVQTSEIRSFVVVGAS